MCSTSTQAIRQRIAGELGISADRVVLEPANRLRHRRLGGTVTYKVTVLPFTACTDTAACNFKANEACIHTDSCGVCGGTGTSCLSTTRKSSLSTTTTLRTPITSDYVVTKPVTSNYIVTKPITSNYILTKSETIQLLCPCNDTLTAKRVAKECINGVVEVCGPQSVKRQYPEMCTSCQASYEDSETNPWDSCVLDVLEIIADHCDPSAAGSPHMIGPVPRVTVPQRCSSGLDCSGTCGGKLRADSCGVCGGDGSSCLIDNTQAAIHRLCPCSGTMSADSVSNECIAGVLHVCRSPSLHQQYWQMCTSCQASLEDNQTPWDSCAINVLRTIGDNCPKPQMPCTRDFCSQHGECSIDTSIASAEDRRVCKCDAMYARSRCNFCAAPLRVYPDCGTRVKAEAAPINTNRAVVSVVWGLRGVAYSPRYEELTNKVDGLETSYNSELDLNDPAAQLFLYDACFNISSESHLVQQRLGSGQVRCRHLTQNTRKRMHRRPYDVC